VPMCGGCYVHCLLLHVVVGASEGKVDPARRCVGCGLLMLLLVVVGVGEGKVDATPARGCVGCGWLLMLLLVVLGWHMSTSSSSSKS